MLQARHIRSWQLVMGIASLAICLAYGQAPRQDRHSLTTPDRLEDAGWWPTKGDISRTGYVGASTCKECHGKIAIPQEFARTSQKS
jgi:hypothetical protein